MAWISGKKVAAISAGIALVALAAKLSAPLATELAVAHPPRAWSSVAAWLRPPYLYVLINGIIICIAASSRFHNNNNNRDNHRRDDDERLSAATSVAAVPEEGILCCCCDRKVMVRMLDQTASSRRRHDREIIAAPEVIKTVDFEYFQAEDSDKDDDHDVDDRDDHDETVMITAPTRTDSWEESLTLSAEKPLVSASRGHRKPLKPSPDQGGLRALTVTEPERHATLEDTWKAITERRSRPSRRHVRRRDTWGNRGRQIVQIDFSDLEPPSMKKLETFKDRTNQQLPAVEPGTPRKEPSLSQDELNRRVEAFIEKFNEDMRLQRQESLKQHLEMINRGAH